MDLFYDSHHYISKLKMKYVLFEIVSSHGVILDQFYKKIHNCRRSGMAKTILFFYGVMLNNLGCILTNNIANPTTIVIMIRELNGNSGTTCVDVLFVLLMIALGDDVDANGGATLTSTCIRPD